MTGTEPHPLRIQRRRTKGSKIPDGAVCINRPLFWGNPFKTAKAFEAWLITGHVDPTELVDSSYSAEELENTRTAMLSSLHKLKGKQLACFCGRDVWCHGDTLARMANKE